MSTPLVEVAMGTYGDLVVKFHITLEPDERTRMVTILREQFGFIAPFFHHRDNELRVPGPVYVEPPERQSIEQLFESMLAHYRQPRPYRRR